jgi:hypothetical protein
MEYASGGELFERICNAGRFSEDEVLIIFHSWILNAVPLLLRLTLVTIMLCCRHGFSSNNLYQELATVMQWYIISPNVVFTFTIAHLLPKKHSKMFDSNRISLFVFHNKANMSS